MSRMLASSMCSVPCMRGFSFDRLVGKAAERSKSQNGHFVVKNDMNVVEELGDGDQQKRE